MDQFYESPGKLDPGDWSDGDAWDPNLPGGHARSQVPLSQEFSQELHHGGLIVLGYPAGEEVDFYSGFGQSAGCFVKVELAESRGNNCFQTLLFDIHTGLVVVVISAAIVLGVIGRLQIHRVQHHS